MRFTKLYIPKELYDNNIADIEMERLSQIVVLVGKNGSGKTRVLEKLNKFSNEYVIFNKDVEKSYEDNISNEMEYARNLKERIEKLEKSYGNVFQDQRDQMEKQEEKILQLRKKRDSLQNSARTKESFHGRSTVSIMPKETSMHDPISSTMVELKLSIQKLRLGNLNKVSDIVLPIIQSIQNTYYDVMRMDFDGSDIEKNRGIEEYENLKYWIKEFIGVELTRKDSNACLFGFNIGEAKLSDGQAILLQLCVSLYQTRKNLNNFILSIDEPENHMHPSAIIEALKKIIEATKESQVWIATHSLPIIAYLASLPETSIYYVEDGKVSFAGSAPEKVLEGLLGDEEQIGKLHDFIGLPAQYAINLYAYQCLFEPAVVETGENDPQTNQIKSVLDGLRKDKSLKLLDYGAGKGRLLANISETNKELLQALDYVAFDKFDLNKNHCEEVITSAYENKPNSYYNLMVDLKAVHRGSFDVVLLCNVLHEIEPSDWLGLIKEHIVELLSENGMLLIVEDSQIPIGEKAHQHGFIVFDEAQIRELFAIGSANDFISQPHPKNNRLKAHLIPKKYLSNVSVSTRQTAIKSLNDRAKDEIKKLRDLDPKSLTFKQGREHAFWVQQFANTQLALDTL